MPELPEVQTVLDTLALQLKDVTILDVDIRYKPIVLTKNFRNKMIGQTFRDFKRRGKYLLFEMDDITFVSHLRMEGKYYLLTKDDPIDKHTHVIFKLSNEMELRYHDVRKFGRMELIPKTFTYNTFKDLGPEPFDSQFNLNYCKNHLSKIHKPIKEELLNQSFVAGIGNIYADEICFYMHVNPCRPANSLNDNEIKKLITGTRTILRRAIIAGGTTIRSYTSSLGVTGRFQMSLNVHTQSICKKCKTEIKKIRIGGRGTYYCPQCQK